MPNRIIREGILTSDRVDSLSPNAELFYRRLMSVVDDFGRFDARPQMLRVSCYPLRVDRVREADISRWLAEAQAAGLIALYAVNGKPYLEMQDFKQQVRAKESKFPSPANRNTTECSADATHLNDECSADEHVDGGGDVSEGDIKPPPPAGERDESFPMTLDWMPSQHFPTLAKQAMLPMPGSELFAASLAEFRAYWIGQSTRHRTQHEWDHALIKSLKSEKARGAFREVSSQSNARASPAKSSIHAEREAVSFGLTGRKPKPNELPNAASERDITAEAIRIA